MTRVLHCADAGFECDEYIEGENDDEVMSKAAEHVREALARGYLQPGACPGGAESVLKPVAAVEGDTVDITLAGVSVNGAALANTAQLDQDSAGRALQPVPPGSYRVAPGEVWLLSSHSPLSWDARYWGPLPAGAVRATARPLLVLP